MLKSSSDVTTEASSNAEQPIDEATATREQQKGADQPVVEATTTREQQEGAEEKQALAGCHQSGRAVNTRFPHHMDTGISCSFSEMELQCGAQAERGSSKILLQRPPGCPPHTSLLITSSHAGGLLSE